ncbi:MAG: hypothetical protein ACR2RB_12635 [Gammaproteobacteria bacterium]
MRHPPGNAELVVVVEIFSIEADVALRHVCFDPMGDLPEPRAVDFERKYVGTHGLARIDWARID